MTPEAETAAWIERLAVPHRAQEAYRALRGQGFATVPALRDGLRHESADIRYHCVRLLDFFLVPEALDDLLARLGDPDPRVRVVALHTLACDRCKQGECRPPEAAILPEALRQLRDDSDRHVRAMAVEVVGRFVHTNPEAEKALTAAHRSDPHPMVRKKAGWFVPGGPVHTRTKPRDSRRAAYPSP